MFIDASGVLLVRLASEDLRERSAVAVLVPTSRPGTVHKTDDTFVLFLKFTAKGGGSFVGGSVAIKLSQTDLNLSREEVVQGGVPQGGTLGRRS